VEAEAARRPPLPPNRKIPAACVVVGMRTLLTLSLAAAALFAAPPKIDPLPQPGGVYFEPNVGQFDPQVHFYARGAQYQAWITSQELVLAQSGGNQRDVVRIRFGGKAPKAVHGQQKLASYSNYFIGNDPEKWHPNVPHYAKARLDEIYPGIDIVFYGKGRDVEFDFVVKPGADANLISMDIQGGRPPNLGPSGDITLATKVGTLTQHAPVVLQQDKVLLAGTRLSGRQVRFSVEDYDPTEPLIIDPVVTWATLLGGSGDDVANGVALDFAGGIFVTGQTASANFPLAMSYDGALTGLMDVFVTYMMPNATSLVYSTYIGGSDSFIEEPSSLRLDPFGSPIIAGTTRSTDFPVTSSLGFRGSSDAFVVKLGPAGNTLAYSVVFGGGSSDYGSALAVDSFGNAYVTGSTASSFFGFPTTFGALNTMGVPWDLAFVTKLNRFGVVVYSTFLYNGSGKGIAVDSGGNAYVTGYTRGLGFTTTPGAFDTNYNGDEDAFVIKLNPSGNGLVYSTFLGSSDGERAFAVAVDNAGSAYVTGMTFPGFPLTPGVFNSTFTPGNFICFVTKLNGSGTALDYSTLLTSGVGGVDQCKGIAVGPTGKAYVTGDGISTGGVIAEINSNATAANSGQLPYGQGQAITVDFLGNAYVAGRAYSAFGATGSVFDLSYNGGGSDAFVAKVAFPLITDSTPPFITGSVAPPANGAGWHKTPATVSWTVTDAQSAITSQTGCAPTTLAVDALSQPLTCSATSTGGTASSTVTVKLDQVPPAIIAAQAPPANGAGWNNSDVTVSFTCNDSLSGILNCTAPVVLNSDGVAAAPGTAQDTAGNTAAASHTVKLDKTPPGITASVPSPGGLGWYLSPFTITWTCTDALSGVVTATIQQSITSGGANQSRTAACTDLAGNSSSHTVSGLNVDLIAPSLSFPGDITVNATSPSGAVVAWTVLATDDIDPSPVTLCAPSSPSLFPVGITQVVCQATDQAGNGSAAGPFNVTVLSPQQQVTNLTVLLTAMSIGPPSTGLLAKLNTIGSGIQAGNLNQACKQLDAFITNVQAQDGNSLTAAQAAQLVAAADGIKAALGCI
jgi:hypothetical protein